MKPAHYILFVDDATWHIGIAQGDDVRVVKVGAPDEVDARTEAIPSGDAPSDDARSTNHPIVDPPDPPQPPDFPDSPAPTSPELTSPDHKSPLAAMAVAALRQQGYRAGPVTLALPSHWCMAATISTDDLPAKTRHQAMRYRMEEQLPLPSEDLVAQFIEQDDRALGIAIEMQRIAPIVASLEEAGIPIELICPAAVLAWQSVAATSSQAIDAMAITGDDHVDLFALKDKRICHWHVAPPDAPTVAMHLRYWAYEAGLDQAYEVALVHESAPLLSEAICNACAGSSPAMTVIELPDVNTSYRALAAGAAWHIHSGQNEAVMNFRCDQLAVSDRLRRIRMPLAACLAAALLLLLTITAMLMHRAGHYQDIAQAHRAQSDALYVELFDEPPPGSVRVRMESRLRELEGLRGLDRQSPRTNGPDASALLALHQCLAQLPADIRMLITDIRIGPDALILAGSARSHSDADRIAAALRSDGAFIVEPPRTQNLPEQGVSFVLRCQRIAPADEPKTQTAATRYQEYTP